MSNLVENQGEAGTGWKRKELENFSYRIDIQPDAFLVSGVVLVTIAWVTLSYFTVRASRLNPAETLKNE